MVHRKCDRCKNMYLLNLDDKTPEPNGYGEFNSIATVDISECIANSTRQHVYYLCPNCRNNFNKWLKGEAVTSKYTESKLKRIIESLEKGEQPTIELTGSDEGFKIIK